MRKAGIGVFYFSMLAILTSITSTSANDYENLVHNASSEVISDLADNLDLETLYSAKAQIFGAALWYTGCYERKRVWTWSGWFPKRVWKWVRVSCPQAASFRGPGTTIPPH